MTKKIPVEIVQIQTPTGALTVDIKINLADLMKLGSDAASKIHEFKKNYFQLLDDGKAHFMRKKKATDFWKFGRMLHRFNNSPVGDFVITNYLDALERDFKLYKKTMIGSSISLYLCFKKKEIDDNIPFTYYQLFCWKSNIMKNLGIFEDEKQHLLKMGKNKNLVNKTLYSGYISESCRSVASRQSKNDVS